jgi:hypothetical protein
MAAISEPHEVVSLRGPEVRNMGRRFWITTSAIILAVLASIVVVSFVSASNDNARIDRLKTHGVSVIVTVTNCVGNIGGSGSNAAGYTCHGEYQVDGVRYREIIGSKTSFSATGSTVRGVADPAQLSRVEIASAVTTSSSSPTVYVVPSLLALIFVALALVLLRRLGSNRQRIT